MKQCPYCTQWKNDCICYTDLDVTEHPLNKRDDAYMEEEDGR